MTNTLIKCSVTIESLLTTFAAINTRISAVVASMLTVSSDTGVGCKVVNFCLLLSESDEYKFRLRKFSV